MFIELTDHLRCPADHPESFLVLLPSSVVERSVQVGELGCPICHRVYHIRDGIPDFGTPAPVVKLRKHDPLDGAGIAALLGLAGPGGFVGLVGGPAAEWRELAVHLPGVHLAAVNPPRGVQEAAGLSVLRATAVPFKAGSLRGIILGAEVAENEAWEGQAVRAVLPGLRVVGQGEVPEMEEIEILANAGGWWVGARKKREEKRT